jgi:hypothetical protein
MTRPNHQMESVGRAGAVGRGIGERINDLQLFDDRAWQPMRDDQRQGIFVFRTNVNLSSRVFWCLTKSP